MIKPEEIPQFTGDLGLLEKAYGNLKTDAGHIRSTGQDVHTKFQGLSAYYTAPEAERLFASTKPVQDRADTFATGLESVSGALSGYATEIRPLVKKLADLKDEATTFVNSVKDDDDWQYDGDKVDRHNRIRDEITRTVAAFWAAERTCHNKITALFPGGTQMVAGDGSDRKDQYGFNADDLKNAKLPWGDPVEEKHHVWEVGHWIKSFVWDGLIVDGVWGTIKGLGTLVGFGGWEAMGQAWKGLAQLATGLVLTSLPGLGTLFWALPDDKLPSWIRDSRTAMKETGKALVAWDEWGKNPARAAGAVTFNVLTTVFTGGAGGAASGAGKAGAVAKALSVAGKAGRVIDPMTYVAKGAGAGLSKIGDITKALKGIGKIDIPALPENAITLPKDAFRLPDGSFHLPEGTPIPEGATKLPNGTFKLPDDVPVVHDGAHPLPAPDHTGPLYGHPDGHIVDGNGKILIHADELHKPPTAAGTGPADSGLPHTPNPTREPALVGTAPHTATETAAHTGDHLHLGNSLDTHLGDLGRTGDDLAPPHHGDTTPDHTPGGHAGDHMPRNELDNPLHNGHDHTPATGGGHHPENSSATEHSEGSGGSDGHGTGGGHHEPPSTGDLHPTGPGHDVFDHSGAADENAARDAAHHPDEAARHRAEYEAAREKPADERTPGERAAVTREHVRLANEDPVWRAEHYDKWGLGKRNDSLEMVDGQLLPKLVEKPGGGWMAADQLPYANPEKYHLDNLVRGRDTVDPHDLKHLDEVAAKRRAGMDLTHAEKAFHNDPSDITAQALDDAQRHFDLTVGEGVSNNTKLGEALGEEAARRHMLLQKEFEGAHEITDLPDTPNGSKRFDQLWRDKDGNLVIVEAKGPAGTLDWRQGNGLHDASTMVKQGTIEYVRTIVADMTERATTSPLDRKYAKEISKAIKNKTLRYVLVQATENTGQYAGAKLRHFKIF